VIQPRFGVVLTTCIQRIPGVGGGVGGAGSEGGVEEGGRAVGGVGETLDGIAGSVEEEPRR